MTETKKIAIQGLRVSDQYYPAPVRPIQDAVLIIYSAGKTHRDVIRAAERAVNAYHRKNKREERPPDRLRYIRTTAMTFRVPAAAPPGESLGTELLQKLNACVGAIAFVDDLRPNVAYELGLFHGRGVPVLLLTVGAPDQAWAQFSDMGGCAVGMFEGTAVREHIRRYLNHLFTDLETLPAWPTYELPNAERNMLLRGKLTIRCGDYSENPNGEFGRSLTLFQWNCPLDIMLRGQLLEGARFKVALRSPDVAPYAIYFEIRFQDVNGNDRQVWLGLSSWLTRADYRNDERNLPADPLSDGDWRFVTGTFAGLLRQSRISAVDNVRLQRIRIRTGEPESSNNIALEIGYLNVGGLSE